ncbi:unnamed protein product [Auanema sp. JU1783]|nr:unnamed protein product [Auanema sp. JU1783]
MNSFQLLILCTVLPAISMAIGFSQSVQVVGKLMCHDEPAKNVKLKLYEKGVVFDSFMAEDKTDSNGEFKLSGTETEISSIDPQVNIYHDCDDGWTPCQRRISFKIPDMYITKGTVANKPFNLGVMQLAGKYKGETRDCIHRH